MSNLSQFLGGGGGGLTPKFQEFNSSGTFTPTQALIDAGGYIEVFIVGGGATSNSSFANGGAGGEVIIKSMYLSSTTGISVTIAGSVTGNNLNGASSSFNGSSAGGINITASGGSNTGEQSDKAGASWGAQIQTSQTNQTFTAGCGVLGYGAGGSPSFYGNELAGVKSGKSNTGQGARTGLTSGSGYCLIKWFE